MREQLEKLIKAAKDYEEYPSNGNGAKLNCAIEAAELALQQSDVSGSLPDAHPDTEVWAVRHKGKTTGWFRDFDEANSYPKTIEWKQMELFFAENAEA